MVKYVLIGLLGFVLYKCLRIGIAKATNQSSVVNQNDKAGVELHSRSNKYDYVPAIVAFITLLMMVAVSLCVVHIME